MPVLGHFPTEQAAPKTLYLANHQVTSLKGAEPTRWAMHWKLALNACAITFADRMLTVVNNWR